MNPNQNNDLLKTLLKNYISKDFLQPQSTDLKGLYSPFTLVHKQCMTVGK